MTDDRAVIGADPIEPFTSTEQTSQIDTVRSTTMQLMHEELVRAQLATRLGEAREQQRAARYLHLRRSVRRAEKAAARARLALARSL